MSILVVDDSKPMRMIVKKTLKQAGYLSYEIKEAANGAEALASVMAARPAVVLSDWNMPEMSGYELLQNLNREGISVPFGFITSETSDEMRARATSAGARFLLAKPFTPENMLAALRDILPPA
jgi:two-component system chemotaxis response regulator CheY